ncbi:hypothetical protein ABTM62_20100, partial [Acinetobacter baumannii]
HGGDGQEKFRSVLHDCSILLVQGNKCGAEAFRDPAVAAINSHQLNMKPEQGTAPQSASKAGDVSQQSAR